MTGLRLIGAVLVFFAAVLAVFAAAGQFGMRIGVPFFLWMGVFNVFVIAQFWSFAADLFGGLRLLAPLLHSNRLGMDIQTKKAYLGHRGQSFRIVCGSAPL